MKDILQTLLNLPQKAIFSIENSVLNTVSIHTAKDMKVGLVRLISEIQSGLHSIKSVDIPNIVIKILEHNDDVFLALYHFNLYKNNGWNMVRDVKPINPTLKHKVIVTDHDTVEGVVYIRTGKNKHIVLGLFNNLEDTLEFYKSVPFLNEIPLPVYSLNVNTLEFYKQKIVREGLIADLLSR